MVLAELGAEVVKIEPIAGDQARHIGRYGESMIRAYSRGKRSIRARPQERGRARGRVAADRGQRRADQEPAPGRGGGPRLSSRSRC